MLHGHVSFLFDLLVAWWGLLMQREKRYKYPFSVEGHPKWSLHIPRGGKSKFTAPHCKPQCQEIVNIARPTLQPCHTQIITEMPGVRTPGGTLGTLGSSDVVVLRSFSSFRKSRPLRRSLISACLRVTDGNGGGRTENLHVAIFRSCSLSG